VAVNLERFYDRVRSGLVDAQFRQSATALEEQISHLMQGHEAWCEVEPVHAAGSVSASVQIQTQTLTRSQTETQSQSNDEPETRPVRRMECLMLQLGPTELAENLHETSLHANNLHEINLHDINGRLRVVLDRLSSDPNHPNLSPCPATPQQMAGLLSELMRAGQWLRTLPHDRGPRLELELNAYRKNVERLRAVLPSIHNTLLRERARLEQERARVHSAAAWDTGSRQTL
jgi:hypothetical protein